MIQVRIEEEQIASVLRDGDTPKEWVEILKITSGDPKIIAAALRGAADKYDPPQRPHR